jgi:cystathionine beta-lyase/cystathionine gamma-synthase
MTEPSHGAAPHPDTTAITSGRTASGGSLAPVLFPSTAYEVETVAEQAEMVASARPDRLYSRFGSPTVRDLEAAVAELEGAEAALASSSGCARRVTTWWRPGRSSPSPTGCWPCTCRASAST